MGLQTSPNSCNYANKAIQSSNGYMPSNLVNCPPYSHLFFSLKSISMRGRANLQKWKSKNITKI
jgi:hypothetical protein